MADQLRTDPATPAEAAADWLARHSDEYALGPDGRLVYAPDPDELPPVGYLDPMTAPDGSTIDGPEGVMQRADPAGYAAFVRLVALTNELCETPDERDARGDAWAAALDYGAHHRRQRVTGRRFGNTVTGRGLIAADAAAIGLVPDPADPDARARYRELGDVAAIVQRMIARRQWPGPTASDIYADHDGWNEAHWIAYGRWAGALPPVYAAGAAALRLLDRSPADVYRYGHAGSPFTTAD